MLLILKSGLNHKSLKKFRIICLLLRLAPEVFVLNINNLILRRGEMPGFNSHDIVMLMLMFAVNF